MKAERDTCGKAGQHGQHIPDADLGLPVSRKKKQGRMRDLNRVMMEDDGGGGGGSAATLNSE